jgi:hypothetical protein
MFLVNISAAISAIIASRRRSMKGTRVVAGLLLVLGLSCLLNAADNLKLNPNLDYSDHNKNQGRLFGGDNLDDGFVEGKVNYIIFYFEKCYNAKRQARVTYHMYERYKDRVHFVIVDLNLLLPPNQMKLARKYCSGKVPHTTILDKNGGLIFDFTGEADETTMAGWLDYALRVAAQNEEQAAGSTPVGKVYSSSPR